MITITKEFTKEQLIAKAREQIAFCRNTKITGEGRENWSGYQVHKVFGAGGAVRLH